MSGPWFVRWATDAEIAERRGSWPAAPPGYALAVVIDTDDREWRLAPPDSPRRKCRHSPRNPCRAKPVMEMNRRRPGSGSKSWWAYCDEHAFGRWIEGGQVVHFALRPVEAAPSRRPETTR